MDPTRPESFTHKWSLLATGRRYHYVDEVPHDYDPQQDLTILCIHGFPDFWYVSPPPWSPYFCDLSPRTEDAVIGCAGVAGSIKSDLGFELDIASWRLICSGTDDRISHTTRKSIP